MFFLLRIFECDTILDDRIESSRLDKSLFLFHLCFFFALLVIGGRPNETQHDGKEEKTVKEAKDDDQEEDLEEGGEDVGLGAGKEDEGQEGGEATVEDCRTNVRKCLTYLNMLRIK